MAMKQVDLLSTAAPAPAPDVDTATERDLFGNPINRYQAAPTYRPRAPVQQALDLTPGAFTLE